MTDKEKIREEVQRLMNELIQEKKNGFGSDIDDACILELQNVLTFIDSLQEDPVNRTPADVESAMQEVEEKSMAFTEAHQGENTDTILAQMRGEEPVSNVWHDSNEEPNNMSHCLVFYGDKNDIGHYLHYEPVLYNKKEKVFVTKKCPHPTGYKIEQKSVDGGCVAEVYKDKRDRISISDITSWCYLNDLHNLTQKKEPVSEDLEEAAYYNCIDRLSKESIEDFKAGAKWKKKQMLKNVISAELYSDGMLTPLIGVKDKEKLKGIKFGDNVKLIIIKDERL